MIKKPTFVNKKSIYIDYSGDFHFFIKRENENMVFTRYVYYSTSSMGFRTDYLEYDLDDVNERVRFKRDYFSYMNSVEN